jgi:Fic family protein
MLQSTSFLQTQTILRALEFGISKGAFGSSAQQKKAAAALIGQMKSNKSVSGRHQQLLTILKKGATIAQMIKATSSSRRTIFRYLNHLEEAGVNLELENGRYRIL